MIRVLFAILFIGMISCQDSKPQMDDLEFFNLIETTTNTNLKNEVLSDGWYETQSTSNNFERTFEGRFFFVKPRPILVPANFTHGEEFENNQGFKGFSIYLDKPGTDAWSNATEKNQGEVLIFVLENEIISAQMVNEQINSGVTAFWKKGLTETNWKKITTMAQH